MFLPFVFYHSALWCGGSWMVLVALTACGREPKASSAVYLFASSCSDCCCWFLPSCLPTAPVGHHTLSFGRPTFLPLPRYVHFPALQRHNLSATKAISKQAWFDAKVSVKPLPREGRRTHTIKSIMHLSSSRILTLNAFPHFMLREQTRIPTMCLDQVRALFSGEKCASEISSLSAKQQQTPFIT